MSSLPGNNLVSEQFNSIIIPLILANLFGFHQRRLPIFEWMITILGSCLVLLGTFERVLQIHGFSYDPSFDWHTIPSQVKAYFYQSLTAWIACVIVDGRHTLNIIQDHGRELLRLEWRVTSIHRVLELIGVLISCTSMVRFSFTVYSNFTCMTDDPSLYFWYFSAVFFKILRILVQGLVLTLGNPGSTDLTRRLMFTSIFLTIQVLFLAQFSPLCSLSAPLLMADVVYRGYQCWKIAKIMNLHTKMRHTIRGLYHKGKIHSQILWRRLNEAFHAVVHFLKQGYEAVTRLRVASSSRILHYGRRLCRLLLQLYTALPLQFILTTTFFCIKMLLLVQSIPFYSFLILFLLGDVVYQTHQWWRIARNVKTRRQLVQILRRGQNQTRRLGAVLRYALFNLARFRRQNQNTCSECSLPGAATHKLVYPHTARNNREEMRRRVTDGGRQTQSVKKMEQQQETGPLHHTIAQLDVGVRDNLETMDDKNLPKLFLNQRGEDDIWT